MFDGLCSADMYPLSPTPGLLGGYLASVILGQRFSRFAASVSGRSSGMPKVNRRELAEFRIAVPQLEVQKIVADLAEYYESRIDAETAILHKVTETRALASRPTCFLDAFERWQHDFWPRVGASRAATSDAPCFAWLGDADLVRATALPLRRPVL